MVKIVPLYIKGRGIEFMLEKKYRLPDYIFILAKFYPAGVCAIIINRVVTAFVPAIQTLLIASLIDRIRLVLNSGQGRMTVFGLVAALLVLINNASLDFSASSPSSG